MINNYVALDLETTGFSPYNDKITEIGAVLFENGIEKTRFETFVNPGVAITPQITKVTGITDEMVKDAPDISEVIEDLLDFIGNRILLGHNIRFDFSFIAKASADKNIIYKAQGIDTYKVSQRCLPDISGRSLENICDYFGIETIHHRAAADAVSASEIYHRMCSLSDSDKDVFELYFKSKKPEKITDKQINFLRSLINRYSISYDKNIGDLTKSEASREIDRILSTYGYNR